MSSLGFGGFSLQSGSSRPGSKTSVGGFTSASKADDIARSATPVDDAKSSARTQSVRRCKSVCIYVVSDCIYEDVAANSLKSALL